VSTNDPTKGQEILAL
jgi:hypothetical protein